MKKTVLYDMLVIILALGFVSCPNEPDNNSGDVKPIASDFIIGNLSFTYTGVHYPVTISPKPDKFYNNISVYYNGVSESTLNGGPHEVGSYNVTFDVGRPIDWYYTEGLVAGVMTISPLDFETAISLISDRWYIGNIVNPNDVNLFKFTATADTHYIYFQQDILQKIFFTLYDSNGISLSDNRNRFTIKYKNYFIVTLEKDFDYYIVIDGSYYDWNDFYALFGTYLLCFSASLKPQNIFYTTLNTDIWTDGSGIQTSSGSWSSYTDEEWFKFTATANIQYIHFKPDHTKQVDIQLFDSNGEVIGNEVGLSSYTAISIISGKEYYIRVTPYNDTTLWTYKIGFTESEIEPSS